MDKKNIYKTIIDANYTEIRNYFIENNKLGIRISLLKPGYPPDEKEKVDKLIEYFGEEAIYKYLAQGTRDPHDAVQHTDELIQMYETEYGEQKKKLFVDTILTQSGSSALGYYELNNFLIQYKSYGLSHDISTKKSTLIKKDSGSIVRSFWAWEAVWGKNIFTHQELLSIFINTILEGEYTKDAGFPYTTDNIINHMHDDDILLSIEQDRGLISDPKPWSKKRFLDNPDRVQFIQKDTIATFLKFGTVISLSLLEGTKNVIGFKTFYNNQVMGHNQSRNIILQLGEVFNLIFAQGNYDLIDELSSSKHTGTLCRKFIEDYNISDKGKTIITLLFANEINIIQQCHLSNTIESLLDRIEKKLIKYSKILDIYKNIPTGYQISLGLEYEVTSSIAQEYHNRTKNEYTKDIKILSAYSGIAQGNDAVHEIATKPTNNPYLLILELVLLDGLDFINLNFDMSGYEKGSRSFHITIGSENGFKYDAGTNFIQNILIASNLGGINTGNQITKVNKINNIRDKGYDCDLIFGKTKTPVTEFRSLSIDRAESFERCIVGLYSLSLGKNAFDSCINNAIEFTFDRNINITSFDDWYKDLHTKNMIKSGIQKNNSGLLMAYYFYICVKDIIDTIIDHNENFYDTETGGYVDQDGIHQNDFLDYRKNKEIFGQICNVPEKILKQHIQENAHISLKNMFQQISHDVVNIFTFINNLYLKPPSGGNNSSINAGAVFDCTKISKGNNYYFESDPKACRKTVFHHAQENSAPRIGRYQIQGSSDIMIVNRIQEIILEYTYMIQSITQNKKRPMGGEIFHDVVIEKKLVG